MKQVFAFLLPAALMLALMPSFITFLRKKHFGQTMYELGPQSHLHKQGTPNMGGILIASTCILSALSFSFAGGFVWQMLPLLLVSLAAMAVGFADDYIKVMQRQHEGLKPMQKILGQVVAGLLFSLFCYYAVGSSIRLPFTAAQWDLGIFYIPLMTLLVIFMTNSANLQDGADGLLSSVTVVGALAFGVIALMFSPVLDPLYGPAVSIGMFALAGAAAGFLWFNRHPARIMMGDTGSMFIGGMFVGAAMLLGLQLLLIPICFTMIMSSVSVIMQRIYFKLTHGKRIFKMSPIHHHFELSGMSENSIVIMYSLTTLGLSVLALLAARAML